MGTTESIGADLRPRTAVDQGFILRTVDADGLLGIVNGSALGEVAIWVEPPESALGLRDVDRSTRSDEDRDDGFGQLDFTVEIYGLRRWCRAAMGGSLEMLLPLYAPEEQVLLCTDAGQELREQSNAFVAGGFRERLTREVNAACDRVAALGLPLSPAFRALLEDLLGKEVETEDPADLAGTIGDAPIGFRDPPPDLVLQQWMVRTYRERWEAIRRPIGLE